MNHPERAEPKKCNEIVFEDGQYVFHRIWKWDIRFARREKKTGLLKPLISGFAFNFGGVSTFITVDGERLTDMDFDYIDDFSDGLALVAISGYGYGFADEQMRLVVPMIYEYAEEFEGGKAKVMRDGKWYFIDKTGKETLVAPKAAGIEYQEVGRYSEGLCRVATLKLCFEDLAYYSDHEEDAGIWGYVNEAGEEVIAPQYIYAEDFFGGIAVVCKGKWTKDPKWDNEHEKGCYWAEEELWGAIDRDGNTAIPFVFDDIKHFPNAEDVFMAHSGGWENGHWGVIDAHGNWLAEPVFADIDYEYRDGLFAFYNKNRFENDVRLGVYDIRQRKVILEPQFDNISFRDGGWIKVEVFDETVGRTIQKLIDRNGREKFHSVYTYIESWETLYRVTIHDAQGDRDGLIDENGNTILPCVYNIAWNGIDYKHRRMIVSENGKQGVRDFSGRTIIPPRYYQIRNIDRPFFTVQVGDKENHTEGLISESGKKILPAVFKNLYWYDDHYLLCQRSDRCEMLYLTVK